MQLYIVDLQIVVGGKAKLFTNKKKVSCGCKYSDSAAKKFFVVQLVGISKVKCDVDVHQWVIKVSHNFNIINITELYLNKWLNKDQKAIRIYLGQSYMSRKVSHAPLN